MSYGGQQNQNFEPIYAALAARLLAQATVSFTGDFSEGDPVVANVDSPIPLTPGLAVLNPLVPQGVTILSATDTTITLTSAPTGSETGASATAGYASADPVAARLLVHWADMQGSGQPALFVTQTGETAEKRPGQLTKWTLDCLVYIYCYAPNDRTPVAPTMNVLLGALRGSFGPDASGPGRVQGRQTLGGLVFDVWINGKIETDEGFLGQQGVAKVPIRIIQNGP